MKKLTLLSGLALMALCLAPQVILADDDCTFTPDLFPGQSKHRTDFEVEAVVNVGEFAQATNTHSWVTNLTSTNQSVVTTHNQNGYTAVFITGVGSADVTYTETMFTAADGGASGEDGIVTGTECVTNHTIHYTVIKGAPEAYFEAENKPVTEYRTDPNAFSQPYLRMIVKEVRTVNGFPQFQELNISAMQCTFTSSNENVAIIGRGNTVTLTGQLGETVITATWAGDANWTEATASYLLKVENPKQSVMVSISENDKAVTDTVGRTKYPPTPLVVPATAAITRWVSEDPTIASVDATTGVVTMLKSGKTRIFAIVDEDDTYYSAQAWYDLTVVKPNPGLAFSTKDLIVEQDVPFTLPTLLNPNNIELTEANSKWYTAWDSKVATVNEQTGEVTVVGVGDETITFEFTGNEDYNYAIVSYNLHVTTSGLTVCGVQVNSLNASDVLGDGKVTFDKETNTLTLNEWTLDAADLDESIRNAVIRYEQKAELTIVTRGSSSIINAEYCITADNSALIIQSATKNGILTLNANVTAVRAAKMKIQNGIVKASSNVIPVRLSGTLHINTGGHLLAQAIGEGGAAIMLTGFEKGNDNINIMTKGVHYYSYGEKYAGFFTDENHKESALLVEIGKMPLVIPSDEVTVIDFTGEDPEGNESVIFSASAYDAYNETTGQLEIVTALTDEQVADALETLVPGSSAWVALLPGTLTFDIPAGHGTIQIECMTLPGYTLNVKVDGHAVINITQGELGWANVNYDVAEDTHVVVYLHSVILNTPARIASAATEDPTAADIINAAAEDTGKVMINGQLYIVKGGKVYTASGMEVK